MTEELEDLDAILLEVAMDERQERLRQLEDDGGIFHPDVRVWQLGENLFDEDGNAI